MKRCFFNRMFEVIVLVFAVSLIAGNAGFAAEQDVKSKVDINIATVKELTAVKGIGKKKAGAIVAYRTKKGRFDSISDLTKVKGIGKKTFKKIKEHITVDGG